MGYTITIGERSNINEYGEKGPTVLWLELPDAPRFDGDEMTGQSNERHPSYTGWYEFVKEAGLTGWSNKIIDKHPGIVRINARDLIAVRRRRIVREELGFTNPGFADGQDPILARLLWLEFWIGWAIENCKRPSIANR